MLGKAHEVDIRGKGKHYRQMPALDSRGQTDRLMDSLNSALEPGWKG